ncbi:4'-phosphopantetheinyl transferase family protein [Marinibactrum halimedae]|uniref:4'-phosphopantetheinyl transferase superfamily protein n=1 Tax=Marinibactrum halimedae TaxID=1444977 RepID=A0AA37WMJ1_9GAMM|nr:4'-phosphopantetheinyl transferase superfamily protein [Marinibactrum halimedae]MCD9459924.1 4'-phosphopantetheinyl transferase superfamily protein [Marinibactrum halimedae]GLS25221.1 hypothetical protein GCM10007877_09350 [Marinibactrum halimedae]
MNTEYSQSPFNEPHVYLCFYESHDDSYNITARQNDHLQWLNKEEHERWARFKHLDAQQQYLLGKVIVRQRLSERLNLPNHKIEFEIGPHGRPNLKGIPVDFNISHTKGLVAVTIGTQGRLGVDVERTARRGNPLDIADHYFHPSEVNAVNVDPQENQQLQRFFEFWTLKEAYIKALGKGLQKSLQSFYFNLSSRCGKTNAPGAINLFDNDVDNHHEFNAQLFRFPITATPSVQNEGKSGMNSKMTTQAPTLATAPTASSFEESFYLSWMQCAQPNESIPPQTPRFFNVCNDDTLKAMQYTPTAEAIQQRIQPM